MWSDPTHLETYGKILGFLAAVITFLVVAWPRIKPRAIALWKLMIGTAKLEGQVESLSGKIDTIIRQVTPNGGSSIIDVVNRVEKAQYWQQERTKALLSEVTYGVWESDGNGECYWVNDVLGAMAGAQFWDLRGQNWINIVHPKERDRVMHEWTEAVKHRRNYLQHYTLVNLETGEETEVVAKATVVRDKEGTAIGWIGTITKTGEDTGGG